MKSSPHPTHHKDYGYRSRRGPLPGRSLPMTADHQRAKFGRRERRLLAKNLAALSAKAEAQAAKELAKAGTAKRAKKGS